MKTIWKIAGIAALVAILGAAVVGTIAFAQEAEDETASPWNFREKLHEAIAEVLGIDVDEYDAAVETARDQILDEAVTDGWLTQEQADRIQERMAEGLGPRGMGKGFFGPRMGFGGQGDSLISVAAAELDMTAPDLLTEIQDGKSIADVAEEKGVDPQTITDAFLAQLAEKLDKAVEEGRITQKQAGWMLQQAEERVPDRLDNTWDSCRPGGRPGRLRGFPGQNES